MGKKNRRSDLTLLPTRPLMLKAKLSVPALPSHHIYRSRVAKLLQEGVKKKLTAVVAPAGFGKTVGVAQWLRQKGLPSGWITLDAADNNLLRFWVYLTACLDKVIPGTRYHLQPFLHPEGNITLAASAEITDSAEAAALTEDALLRLIDWLDRYPGDFIVVLDDSHLITERKIQENIAYLLRYAPENMHMFVLARTLPPFLHPFRLKITRQELRAKELLFSEEEMLEYCRLQDLQLNPGEAGLLQSRTGGWAQILHFALDYLRRGQDNGGELLSALQDFGADYGDLYEYLEGEVFSEWPAATGAFMLHTSIPERQCASLCDALMDDAGFGSAETLQELAARSPLVEALPAEEKGWFKYQHLLSEFLRHKLHKERAHIVPELHRRAATWYRSEGFLPEAVTHFLKGKMYNLALPLLEQKAPEMLGESSGFTVLSGWLKQLPVSLLEESGVLSLTMAWSGLLEDSPEAPEKAAAWLRKARRKALDTIRSGTGKGIRAAQHLNQEINLAEAYLAISKRDINEALELATKAGRHMEQESIFKMLPLSWNGPGPELMAGPLALYGRLRKFDQPGLISLTKQLEKIGFPGGYFTVTRAEIHYEWNDLEGAFVLLLKGMDRAERSGNLGALIPAFCLLARICSAHGDTQGALQALAEGEKRLETAVGSHPVAAARWRPLLEALRSRFLLQTADKQAVEQWIKSSGLCIFDTPGYRKLYQQITLARVLLERGRYQEALLLLTRLQIFVQEEEQLPASIEILNLQALTYQGLEGPNRAMEALQMSLTLGREDGYQRIYLDEGEAMAKLLHKFTRWKARQDGGSAGPLLSYARTLLHGHKKKPALWKFGEKTAAVSGVPGGSVIHRPLGIHESSGMPGLPGIPVVSGVPAAPSGGGGGSRPGLPLEPLTRRERQVLGLLARDMSNAEIAATLYITVNTVKVYNKNIYYKLDVRNRGGAVERARQLGII